MFIIGYCHITTILKGIYLFFLSGFLGKIMPERIYKLPLQQWGVGNVYLLVLSS